MASGPFGSVADEEEQPADLRWHWDTAYEINRSGATWRARFLAVNDTMPAGSADELRGLIRTDYLARKTASADLLVREMGAGELALRRLREDRVI